MNLNIKIVVRISRPSCEDILDDPQLHAMLGPDQIAELKKAVEVCRTAEAPEQTWMSARAAEDSDSDILEDCHDEAVEGDIQADGDVSTSSAPSSSLTEAADNKAVPSVSSAAAVAAAVQNWQLLSVQEDGGRIEVRYGGSGTTYCTVRRCFRGTEEYLGTVQLLVKRGSGQESLRAVCKKHKQCDCWISSTSHPDLLLQWLSVAQQESADSHCRLSQELRRSIGMKVRARIQE